VRRAAALLRQRLGRRGAILAILGAGKICYGIGLVTTPPTSTRGLELLTNALPLHCWAWVWIIAGSATFAGAWVRIGQDGVAFFAALIPPAVWGTAYLRAAVDGYPRGWAVAGWFLLSHIGVILWASTVPEHSLPPTGTGESE
jgi:hypothetical protein